MTTFGPAPSLNSIFLRPSSFVHSSFHLSVAIAHDEVQTTEHCDDVAQRAAWQQLRQDAQVHKRRRPDLQSVRDPAALAVDVEAELSFGIFSRKVNLSRRRIETLRHHNEMVNELLHFGHHARLRWRHVFPVHDIDRAVRQFLDDLPKDAGALPHLLKAHEITIVTIPSRADDDLEV